LVLELESLTDKLKEDKNRNLVVRLLKSETADLEKQVKEKILEIQHELELKYRETEKAGVPTFVDKKSNTKIETAITKALKALGAKTDQEITKELGLLRLKPAVLKEPEQGETLKDIGPMPAVPSKEKTQIKVPPFEPLFDETEPGGIMPRMETPQNPPLTPPAEPFSEPIPAETTPVEKLEAVPPTNDPEFLSILNKKTRDVLFSFAGDPAIKLFERYVGENNQNAETTVLNDLRLEQKRGLGKLILEDAGLSNTTDEENESMFQELINSVDERSEIERYLLEKSKLTSTEEPVSEFILEDLPKPAGVSYVEPAPEIKTGVHITPDGVKEVFGEDGKLRSREFQDGLTEYYKEDGTFDHREFPKEKPRAVAGPEPVAESAPAIDVKTLEAEKVKTLEAQLAEAEANPEKFKDNPQVLLAVVANKYYRLREKTWENLRKLVNKYYPDFTVEPIQIDNKRAIQEDVRINIKIKINAHTGDYALIRNPDGHVYIFPAYPQNITDLSYNLLDTMFGGAFKKTEDDRLQKILKLPLLSLLDENTIRPIYRKQEDEEERERKDGYLLTKKWGEIIHGDEEMEAEAEPAETTPEATAGNEIGETAVRLERESNFRFHIGSSFNWGENPIAALRRLENNIFPLALPLIKEGSKILLMTGEENAFWLDVIEIDFKTSDEDIIKNIKEFLEKNPKNKAESKPALTETGQTIPAEDQPAQAKAEGLPADVKELIAQESSMLDSNIKYWTDEKRPDNVELNKARKRLLNSDPIIYFTNLRDHAKDGLASTLEHDGYTEEEKEKYAGNWTRDLEYWQKIVDALEAQKTSQAETSPEKVAPKIKLERDPLYGDAISIVLRMGKASTAILQRELRLGYGRTARMLDAMQEDGIIGPPEGSTPRAIICTHEQAEEFLNTHEFVTSATATEPAPTEEPKTVAQAGEASDAEAEKRREAIKNFQIRNLRIRMAKIEEELNREEALQARILARLAKIQNKKK
jgi:hypothetical protein